MSAPLRVGIVGAGIGVNYAEAFQRIAGAEVVALCASSLRRAGPAADRLGIGGVYTDMSEMLERERPDIVAVATPNDLHHPMTLQALAAGAHVLCDKPLALDTTQALEMLHAAQKRERRHIVPFWWRVLPVVTRAHELLRDGALGDPYFADVRYLNCGWGDPQGPMRWQFDRARAGAGALGNVGSHAIAVLQWLVGDVTEICAHTAVNVAERVWPDGTPARPDGEDTAAFVGVLANGAPVTFLASSVAHEVRSSFHVTVHLSGGSITVSAESHWPDRIRGRLALMRHGDDAPQPLAVDDPAPELARMAPQDVAYTAIAAELVAAITEGRPAAPGFDEGVRVQQVIDAALTSTREHAWVPVDRREPVMVRT
ncbi:MAG: Gfo/Idh/MocA family protein [Solirubrobacteraceae bacterium]